MTTAWKELRKGKSIGRALLNTELSKILPTLTGRVLDLGGGKASYLAFMPKAIELTRTDYTGEGLDQLVDINEPLPFPDQSFDTVLILNALYIAHEPRAVLTEALRILRPGGQLILSTPYLMAEMREPHDYFRFTSQWLEETLGSLGCTTVRLIPIGERVTAAANLLDGFGTRIGKMVTFLFARLGDSLLPARIKDAHPAPILYLTIASSTV